MATKLAALSKAGAYLQFVHARRTPEIFGKGLLSVWPVKGAKQIKAATEAGFAKTHGPVVLRLECPDRVGLGAQVCHALSEAGINVRAFTGIDVAKAGEAYLTLDNSRDAAKAQKILKAMK
jgi:siroheme synthase